jgi:cytochrome oxidase Cu insertion factor (SCO1/SenC/PrrC family)
MSSRLPALLLGLWLTSTLLWWAFAFMPLPATPPAWLTAARVACFGPMETGLPGAAGWMMLVLAPLSFLVGIVVLWGAELPSALRQAARRRWGQGLFAVLALGAVVEGVWVAQRLQAAWTLTAWSPGPLDETALPEAYPRQAAPAPGFTLIDQHGATISLADLRGRPVVLTFVFAHCQTMCPFIVATLRRAAPEGAAVLLVTLDPWRDTPRTLPGIARQWELPPGFHVLSSREPRDVLRVAEAYGVGFQRDDRTGDIVHPGLVFLVDANGRLGYTFNNPPAAWVREGLQRLERAHVLAR